MPKQDTVNREGISQGSILHKMQSITDWMQRYEQENNYPLQQRTKNFDQKGHCFGFSGMILMSSAISDEIARKKTKDPSYSPDDNADNIDEMYARFAKVAEAKMPSDTSSEEAKKLYKEMQLFSMQVIQAQNGVKELGFGQDQLKSMEVLNPSDASEEGLKSIKTYCFTEQASLIKWATKARAGDMLSIITGNHAVSIYVREDEKGDKMVGFYDPNNPQRLEIRQAEINEQAINAFRPFSADYNPDFPDKQVLICTHIAPKARDYGVLQGVESDINRETDKDLQNTAFLKAMKLSSSAMARELISYGVDVNTKDRYGNSPLHYASNSGNVEVATLLRDRGANVNAQNKAGITPLESALMSGQIEMVKSFFNRDNKPDKSDVDKSTDSLRYAIIDGDVDKVKSSLDKGVNPNASDEFGIIPLHYAVASGNTKSIQLLLDKGADINARDKHGQTVLHLALRGDKPEVVKFLLDRGANVNAQNKYGETPLHIAMHEEIDTSCLLLSRGANPHIVDAHNNTPFQGGSSDVARQIVSDTLANYFSAVSSANTGAQSGHNLAKMKKDVKQIISPFVQKKDTIYLDSAAGDIVIKSLEQIGQKLDNSIKTRVTKIIDKAINKFYNKRFKPKTKDVNAVVNKMRKTLQERSRYTSKLSGRMQNARQEVSR